MAVGTFETGRAYRVHKSYVWLGPIMALLAVVVVGGLNSISGIVQLVVAVQSGELAVNVPLAIAAGVLGVLVVFGLVVGLYALAWRNMSYCFDEREFSYHSGIITKRHAHIPYARVQSVNHRASIAQRLAGVCTVSIDSAGGSSNKAVRVPYLRLETAERLRAELFIRKAAVAAGEQVVYAPHADTASAAGAAWEAERIRLERAQAPEAPDMAGVAANARGGGAPNALDAAMGAVGDWRGAYGGLDALAEAPVSCEYSLANSELLLTAASHGTPITIAVILGASMFVAVGIVMAVGDEFARLVASFAAPIVIVSTFASWVLGLFTVAVSYGNFRVRRRGSRIEVERGLLARDFSGIDIDRVQSIEVRQSFVRRLMGYCELSLGRIDTAAEQGSGNSNSRLDARGLVIHPFVKVALVDELLDGLVPELSERPRIQERRPLPRVALRRAVLRRCLWFNGALWTSVAVGACWAILARLVRGGFISFEGLVGQEEFLAFVGGSFMVLLAICVALTIGFGVSAVLWARHSGYVWNRSFLLVHNDGLSTALSVIPRAKIQSGATRDNPFQRRLGLTSLHATTAAGTSNTTVCLLDIPAEEGAAYLDWLKPRT